MPDELDRLSRELNGMSREQIDAVAGRRPASHHLCPLCGGGGAVTDAALLDYVAVLQRADATQSATAGA